MATHAEKMEIFEDVNSDLRYGHELNGFLSCGSRAVTQPMCG